MGEEHVVRGAKELRTRLMVSAKLGVDGAPNREVSIMVDTGSEVNLVRKDIFAPDHFRQAKTPAKFLAANQTVVVGGCRNLREI